MFFFSLFHQIIIESCRIYRLNAYPSQSKTSFHTDLHELLAQAEFLHDITLEINNNQTYPAHKYILCMRSPYFRQCLLQQTQLDYYSINTEHNTPIDPELFQLILEYIYSDQCPWLTFSAKIRARDEQIYHEYLIRMKSLEDDIDDHRYFERVRQQAGVLTGSKQQSGNKSKKNKKKSTVTSPNVDELPGQQSDAELNLALDRLIDLAKLFQLHSLKKRLETIKQSRQRNADTSEQSIGQIKKSGFHYSRESLYVKIETLVRH